MIRTVDESIILFSKNSGEYNKLVFIFTRDKGTMSAVAYGARKTKNRFGSALEPFTFGRAMLIERRKGSFVSLDQMEIIESSFDLYSDYVVAGHLYYYAEILHNLLPGGQPEENIFRLTLEMLRGFRLGIPVQIVAAYFEVWLLKLSGLLPDHRECHHCSKRLKNQNFIYVAASGYLFCDTCRQRGIDEGKKITGSIYTALNEVFKNKIDSDKLNASLFGKAPLTEWTERLFKLAIEREIKSLKNLKMIRDY
jgi:DNA repair protein RecO (recombination protein O)